ncbi:MAG TPA: ATP-grasp domain-containing protein, partial [Myxococcota bacterium]|nr:ATP-grasp domain-containing protein [Myxococcota bacterium]
RPILLDRFLDGAAEYDVDALCDGRDVYIGGVVEHIEEAGVHSGDSFGVLPPCELSEGHRERVITIARQVARDLGVIGCINLQLAIHEGEVYVLEVNPRASRTVPFVAKATGVPLAKLATRLSLGATLGELRPVPGRRDGLFFVKGPVFPWRKLPGSSGVLGPEMRSTGEVMGVGETFGEAYAKAMIAAWTPLPKAGRVLLSARNRLKPALVPICRELVELGMTLAGTEGTAAYLRDHGFDCPTIARVDAPGDSLIDRILDGSIQLVLNMPRGRANREDEGRMRIAGLRHGVPVLTGLASARAAVQAIRWLQQGDHPVRALQGMDPGSWA